MREAGAWLVWLGVAAAALCLAPWARGQEALSELVPMGALIFCDQDLAELDKAANLTPAQREAAESLMRSGVARARSVYGKYAIKRAEMYEKYTEAAAADPGNQTAYESYESESMKPYLAMNKEFAAIERETLGDIRATLTTEQIANGWPGFERYRRRLMLTVYQGGLGMGWNPRSMVKAIKLDGDDAAAAEAVLGRYELELDPLLAQRMQALLRVNAEAAESGKSDASIWARPEFMSAQINKLNIRTAHAIEKALSESGRKLFLRERIGVELNGISRRPAMDPWVRQILRLETLSDDQRVKAAEFVANADAKAYEAGLAELHRRDAAALQDEHSDAAAEAARAAQVQLALTAPLSSLMKQLRALLTPEQMEEINEPYYAKKGEDSFKVERSPAVKSEWNADPSRKTENDP